MFEPLEPRYLLSADLMPFMVDMAVDGHDLTLDLDSSFLRILDNRNADSVVAERALDATDGVVVQGSDEDDRLTIDFDAAFWLPTGIRFDAGLGADQLLIGAGQFTSVAYGALGPDSGTAQLSDGTATSTVDYTGLEDFTDLSTAHGRTFVDKTPDGRTLRLIGDADGLKGLTTIDGGGGVNTIDYSATDTPVTVDLSTGAASGAGGIANMQELLGGTATDTIIGAPEGGLWRITGTDTGTVEDISFSGFENVVGGEGADIFVFESLGSPSGRLSGGSGLDTLVGTDEDNLWVVTGADEGTLNGLAYTGIEHLAGGLRDDEFVFLLGGFVSGAIAGGLGLDRIRAANERNVWRIISANAGTLNGQSFTGIEGLESGSMSGLLDGGAGGNDTLIPADGAFDMVTITVLDSETGTIDRDGDVTTFTGLEPMVDNTPGSKMVDDSAGGSPFGVSSRHRGR